MPSWDSECLYRVTILLRHLAPWFSNLFGFENFPTFHNKDSIGWELGDASTGSVLKAKDFGFALCIEKPNFTEKRFANYPIGPFTIRMWFPFPMEGDTLYFDYSSKMDSDIKAVCCSINRLILNIEVALFEKVLKHPSQWPCLRNTRLYNKYKKYYAKKPWEIANHLVLKRTGFPSKDLVLHTMSLLFARDGYL
jgi:hypothetical protein